MVLIDSSAWIEFFRGEQSLVVAAVDRCLESETVIIGDLIYCELMQGVRSDRERKKLSDLLLSLPQYEMLGFSMAAKAAENYRSLRQQGVTVRKTIDVIIATFCVEKGFALLHNDRDFDQMAIPLSLKILS